MNSKSGWKPWKPALRSKSGSEKKSGPWRPTKRQVLWAIGMVVALLTTALLIVNLHPEIWNGLLEERNLTLIAIGVSVTAIIVLLAIGGAASSWTGFRGMTVRDWLDLLVVPLALVVISFLFTVQQDQRQLRTENQRAEAEQELAVQRAQDEALQAYLDQVGTLLLAKDLRNSEEDSEVRTLARARTLKVLGRLDPARKTEVMQFLVEAKLIQSVKGREPIIRLVGADLRGTSVPGEGTFRGAYLGILTLTNLSGAHLSAANLSDANLSSADLRDADLSGADLRNADLISANLRNADLTSANLRNANLIGADLRDANLLNAGANDANLSDANLRDANLIGADWRSADLSDAKLSNADLSNADLSSARGITDAELQQAESLAGATMPDGQTLKSDDNPDGPTPEEWLKSRDREEDE